MHPLEGEGLFVIEPRWCLDTNVVVSFLKETDDEPYSRQLMPTQWAQLERDITSGLIVAPTAVLSELEGWRPRIPELHGWLVKRRGMFWDPDDDVLGWAKRIVNAFPKYGADINYLGDLCVIALARARGLCVITNEGGSEQLPSARRPKIPDVCAHFDVECVTFIGYLRQTCSP